MEKNVNILFTTMTTNMLEIFNYSFMIRAFTAGTVIGIVAPVIGTFLVARRYSLIADTLGHISLAGVAIGLLLGINPIITALVAAVIMSLVIDRLRSGKLVSGESALAMLLSGGLALAIVLISLAKGFNVDLFSYLFGSITTVRPEDLYLIIPLGLLVIVLTLLFYKQLLYISFDEEGSRVNGIKVTALNTLLMVLTAVIVSLSIRIVGSLLIGALIVIPVVTAAQIARSFRSSIALSILFSLFAIVVGLFASFYFNLAAGGTIVLVALIVFAITSLFK
ncbi:MAG TPA: metal ABC transporter permease [Patescibacteria group bacterium]